MKTDFIIRDATLADMWDIYTLANSPEVRLISFSHDSISRKEHEKWFLDKLKDKKCHVFVITNISHQFIGSIRFDITSFNEYVVSTLIIKEFRCLGIGTKVIQEASGNILKEHPNCYIKAFIFESNMASIKSFLKAGYRKLIQNTTKDKVYFELIFP